jgi:hypothetical protein
VVVFGQESVGERVVPLLIGGKAVAAKGRLGQGSGDLVAQVGGGLKCLAGWDEAAGEAHPESFCA